MKIPITKAVFDENDKAQIIKPLETGWVVQGPYVTEFEKKFEDFTKSKYALAATSCTTALHMALAALKVGPGDEVIVPAFTWIASANSVEYQGARVVFCDIDLNTFNIDIQDFERKITKKTKAVMPVHLFGLSAEMDKIMEIARANNLYVVEDAACGFGSRYKNQHVGTIGDFGCFSFHPRKAITTGEGGMLTTNNKNYFELAKSLRDHGASRSDFARHGNKAAFLLSEFNVLGYNYRMTDIQGALGVSQMAKADWILAERRKRAKEYTRELSSLSWLGTPFEAEDYEHSFQSYVCLFKPEKPNLNNFEKLNDQRNDIMMRLEEIGISTRQGTHAVTNLGYYLNKYSLNPRDYPNALLADKLSITLPIYAQMTDEEQNYVIENIKKVMN